MQDFESPVLKYLSCLENQKKENELTEKKVK